MLNDYASVIMHLLQVVALSILTYALDALQLNKTKLTKLEHPWSRAIAKMFNTFDMSIVMQCQLFTGVLPHCHQYTMRAMAFYSGLRSSVNALFREICLERGITNLSKNWHPNMVMSDSVPSCASNIETLP